MDVNARGKVCLVSSDVNVLCKQQKSRTGFLDVLRTSKCACIYLQKPPSTITPVPYDKEQFNGLVKDTKYAYCDKSESQACCHALKRNIAISIYLTRTITPNHLLILLNSNSFHKRKLITFIIMIPNDYYLFSLSCF